MLSSFRLSSCFSVIGVALALAAYGPEVARAQIPTPSVETYVDQAVPGGPEEGALPEGMMWNKPLKAGDMVLPRTTKPKEKAPTKVLPRNATLPVGDLKAPQLSSNKAAKAPQIAKDSDSTQSMMLIQGMKSALKQAGQNPDLPKSDLVPVEAAGHKPKDILAPVLPSSVAASVPLKKESEGFVSGQEPKGWVAPTGKSGEGAAAPSSVSGATIKPADDGMMDIVFPPEMSAPDSTSDVNAPKATDIAEQPIPLEHATTKKPATESGLMDRLTKPFTSIFGEPVDEATSAQAPAPSKTAVSGKCDPTVTKWTRECSDAGYPAHFVGSITGETRLECPSGEAKDVWLSNSCAAPIASSKYSVQDKSKDVDLNQAAIAAGSSVIVPDVDSSVDGSCGVANGLASDGKPAGDLCSQGETTPVLGEGPWRWSCKGRHGGMTVSCAAPAVTSGRESKKTAKGSAPAGSAVAEIAVEDGKCGEAASVGVPLAPTTGLCAKGTASLVNGSGPWTWACSGINGGMAAACTAPIKTDGLCGAANDVGTDTMPMRDLCAAGYASAVTGTGPWNWSCSGLHGGAAVTCSASAKVNAVCGPASLKGHASAPSDGLCNVGTATAIKGSGPWNWRCEGSLGGASVSCQAPVMADGICGPAHGNQYDRTPTEGLCTSGVVSRVTGLGPWNWSCAGTNGGSTVSCTAVLGSRESISSAVSCGAASEGLALAKPSEKLCAAGKASDVDGDGPWTWSCADKAGHSVSCSTPTATAGTCGKAADVTTSTAPSRNLCATGLSSEVLAFEKKSWKWECQGSMGASSVVCYAPMAGGEPSTLVSDVAPAKPAPAPEAQCGNSAGKGFKDKPDSALCEIGKASAVKGNGPWTWTCGTKTKVTCEAEKLLDGVCGSANGSVQRSMPSSGLCVSGTATEISGNGPWLWSCVGSGGGSSSSCSASAQSQTRVDGTCGAAVNTVMHEAPSSDLCDSGMPSTVYGDGPWTWTCSGMNGGIASTCKSSKTAPKAPPPPGPAVNGVCGPSNGVSASVAPEDGLCSSGMATSLSGHGPWNWGCIGANGGMTVSCTAPLTPPAPIVGACGGAHGVPTLTMPKAGLCSAGIMSAVSGKGPWTWSCSGTNGGGAVSCVAPLAGPGSSNQAIPSMVTPSLDNGEAPAPRAAPVGLVTPQLPTGQLPALKPGTVPSLKTSKKGALPSEASAMPSAKLDDSQSAPAAVPELPSGMQPVNPPPARDTIKPPAGVKPPVLDSEGKPVPGARLVLESDLSTLSFSRGSDQLDKDAVEICEKLANVLKANGNARITLVAYADADGTISPREARRISLNRALAIRDFLASKGISSGRVDVRPMGANVQSGDMDRVDVKVN